jgi:hypothetical protein
MALTVPLSTRLGSVALVVAPGTAVLTRCGPGTISGSVSGSKGTCSGVPVSDRGAEYASLAASPGFASASWSTGLPVARPGRRIRSVTVGLMT